MTFPADCLRSIDASVWQIGMLKPSTRRVPIFPCSPHGGEAVNEVPVTDEIELDRARLGTGQAGLLPIACKTQQDGALEYTEHARRCILCQHVHSTVVHDQARPETLAGCHRHWSEYQNRPSIYGPRQPVSAGKGPAEELKCHYKACLYEEQRGPPGGFPLRFGGPPAGLEQARGRSSAPDRPPRRAAPKMP